MLQQMERGQKLWCIKLNEKNSIKHSELRCLQYLLGVRCHVEHHMNVLASVSSLL